MYFHLKNKIFTLFSLSMVLLSIGCEMNQIEKKNPPKKSESKAYEDDYLIINSIFYHLVFPKLKPFGESMEPPKYEVEDFGYHNHEYNIDLTYNQDVYLIDYLIGMNDTLAISSLINPRGIDDSEYSILVLRLNYFAVESRKLVVNRITNTGFFKLNPLTKKEKLNSSTPKSSYAFSPIVYNKNYTKACFYFEDRCYGLCGHGELVLVEKVNGIWIIKDKIRTWIS